MTKVLNHQPAAEELVSHMVSHGFGILAVMSGTISADELAAFAKQISRVKPIIRSHVVQRIICGEKVGYEIIFEYGHLRDLDMKPADLLKQLKEIRVGEHKIANSTEFLVIQETYQHEKLIDYQPK